MKVLSSDGLTKLIQLIKSGFVSKTDIVQTSEVQLANVATSGSYNDLVDTPNLSGYADTDLSNLTATGKSYGSKLGMPSSRYDNLTLGASGSTYTAPANGWFSLKKQSSGGGQMLSLQTPKIQVDGYSTTNGQYLGLIIPVAKGDVLTTYYTLGRELAHFQFVYAEGEK